MTSDQKLQMVFVVGAPRSGTTLLQNLIASHDGVATSPETHYFVHASRTLLYERSLPPVWVRRPPRRLTGEAARRWLARLQRESEWLGKTDVDGLVTDAEAVVPTGVLAQRFYRLLAGEDAAVFVDKSPPHAYFVPSILQTFPDARIIHIVRDPRDVAASYNDMIVKLGRPPRSAYERARIWRGCVRAARKHRLFTIRFEDLVAHPEDVMAEVFRYLARTFHPALLIGQHIQARQSVRQGETWKADNFGPINPHKIGGHKGKLTDDEIAIVERVCGSEMRRFGYELSGINPDAARLRAERSAYGRMRFRHVLARLRALRAG